MHDPLGRDTNAQAASWRRTTMVAGPGPRDSNPPRAAVSGVAGRKWKFSIRRKGSRRGQAKLVSAEK